METSSPHEDENKRVLYEASYEGCVFVLNTPIQEDPLILHKINSRAIFTETPLHISALLGRLEFTKLPLTHKPKLALEFDSFQSTALHLASAEGHVHIVKELLQARDHACLIPDQRGRIPFHYAVIRGRTNIVFELISAKPESLWILDKRKYVFHLPVMYSHLDILKALMDFDIEARMLLSLRDLDDNTTLDLAAMLKQVDIVRFLVLIPAIREAASVQNETGFYRSQESLQKPSHATHVDEF
ncbi:ankyrin repeat-containing protein At5g02620-like [Neltuma alba]|uniref:ankyrin repeat-containing protein At5g02620-like n=1 Tax=Neltuma alba TaxID=207710 RepID=UPI0010A3DD05|nr:ankyrin repeat-containing protein At5g02620-like [Prosopis alba]